ncbi:hypothetical protein HK101_005946 [Irineochytrium annulatum]|nr:hypothetical protein HK101_005946 [Irineochytrium annulatum]
MLDYDPVELPDEGEVALASQAQVTATDLGNHQKHNCDLRLRLVLDRRRSGFKAAEDCSAKTSAHFRKGIDVSCASGPARRPLSAKEIFAIIEARKQDEFFLVDLTIQMPANASKLKLGKLLPDFVRVRKSEDGIRLQVIDSKASAAMAVSHQVQIGVYARALEYMFRVEGVAVTVEPRAYVWMLRSRSGVAHDMWSRAEETISKTRRDEEDGAFSLELVGKKLEVLLNDVYPKFVGDDACDIEDIGWRYDERCRGCDFEEGCEARVKVEGDLSLIPNLSVSARRHLEAELRWFAADKKAPRRRRRDLRDLPRDRVARNWNQVWSDAAANHIDEFTDVTELHGMFYPTEDGRAPFIARQREELPTAYYETMRILRANVVPAGSPPASIAESPVLRSAIHHSIEPTNSLCLTFPSTEHLAVHLSLGIDPLTNTLYGFSIHQFITSPNSFFESTIPDRLITRVSAGPDDDLAPLLIACVADLILSFIRLHDRRVQFYVNETAERSALLSLLTEASCATVEDATRALQTRICVGALLDHPDALLCAHPPDLLPLSMLLSASDAKLKADVIEYLGVVTGEAEKARGTVAVLTDKLKCEIERRGRSASGTELKMPRIVVLAQAVRDLVCLPRAGYFGFEEVAVVLLDGVEDAAALKEEKAFEKWDNGDETGCKSVLEKRAEVGRRLVLKLRDVATANRDDVGAVVQGPKMLINAAPVLRVAFLDFFKDPVLARMMFMTQVRHSVLGLCSALTLKRSAKLEMVMSYREVIDARLDWSHVCELEYEENRQNFIHRFRVISDPSHILLANAVEEVRTEEPEAKRNSFYKYLLVDATKPEIAAAYDDLKYAGRMGFQARLDEEDAPILGGSLAMSEIVEVVPGQPWRVDLQVMVAGKCGFSYTIPRRKRFKLCRRFMDLNSKKIVSALFETEVVRRQRVGSIPPLFLRFLTDRNRIEAARHRNHEIYEKARLGLNKVYKDVYSLADDAGPRSLLFHLSQEKAYKCILQNMFTTVWGPPGNGKTHTLALAALRMIETEHRLSLPAQGKLHIFMTALTHAAIDTFRKKLEQLLRIRKSPLFNDFEQSGWTDMLTIVSLKDDKAQLMASAYTITLGTVWALFRKLRMNPKLIGSFDILFIDEASQIPVSYGAIALRTIDSSDPDVLSQKRLIIAGDPRQFQPIFKGDYPVEDGSDVAPVFGSILDCFRHGGLSTTCMLTENFRFVKPICDFTSRLYSGSGVGTSGQGFDAQRPVQTLVSHGVKA